ncbi:MAG: hypothetical protein ACRD0C_09745 [Acidimicrobiia bacterium]
MKKVRVVVVVAALLALVVGPVPADAHTGDFLSRPVFERIDPDIPGIEVEVVYTANYQFLITNPTATELVILAVTGEPFIRIGPNGAYGNFNSPSWYNSNVPDGLLPSQIPKRAKEGPDVEPAWTKVSKDPSWGWYDHRLHPVERYVDKRVQQSRVPVTLEQWEVAARYGDQPAKIKGRIEYKPQLGSYEAVLKSPDQPVPDVTVAVVSAQVPAIYLQNNSQQTVTVLGAKDEPFVRIGPHVEVNLHSPSYIQMQQAIAKTPEASAEVGQAEANADSPPNWEEVQKSPQWRWLEFRAAPPPGDPPKELTEREDPTTVKTWKVPILIGENRTEISGITQFVPIAKIQERSRGRSSSSGGNKALPLLAGIGAATLAVGYVVLRPSKAKKAKSTEQARKTQAVRHRSRSTPKKKR